MSRVPEAENVSVCWDLVRCLRHTTAMEKRLGWPTDPGDEDHEEQGPERCLLCGWIRLWMHGAYAS